MSAVTVAKAYRLLKAVLNTAADDGLIRRNPCRIKGASVEKSQERPVLSARQVFDLASAIDPRYRALLLLCSAACGGANSRRFAAPTQTWPRIQSVSLGSWPSCPAADSGLRRPSPMRANVWSLYRQ